MKYKIKTTSKFDKDLKRINKRGYDVSLLINVVNMLAYGEKLPNKYMDHSLTGNYIKKRECHKSLDWLLIYELFEEELILYLTRTGSHSDLF